MRVAGFFLVALIPFLNGCAHLIAESGIDLTALPNKEAVQQRVGQPIASGTENGAYFEEYRTRWKLSEPKPARCSGEFYETGLVLTCGLAECVTVPEELFLLGRRTFFGQPIRVTYNSVGSVNNVLFDEPTISGESYWSKRDPASLANDWATEDRPAEPIGSPRPK